MSFTTTASIISALLICCNAAASESGPIVLNCPGMWSESQTMNLVRIAGSQIEFWSEDEGRFSKSGCGGTWTEGPNQNRFACQVTPLRIVWQHQVTTNGLEGMYARLNGDWIRRELVIDRQTGRYTTMRSMAKISSSSPRNGECSIANEPTPPKTKF